MRRKLEWSGEGEWCEEGGERGRYSDHSEIFLE